MFNLERRTMKKILGAVLCVTGLFASTYVMGQVYDGQHDAVTNPMDRVVVQHAAAYANTGIAGDDQDLIAQEARYTNMIEPMDDANDRHFKTVVNYETVEESSPLK